MARPVGVIDGSTTNFVDFGMQNSRGFRALKVWMTIRQVGRDGYARMIADDHAFMPVRGCVL